MRIAAIDIGTNSIHMIVVQIRPDLSFEVIDREKEMVRLGAGGLDGRALTPEAVHAALQVLSKFGRLAESHQVEEVIAVATSATRESENGGEFLKAVTDLTGIRPRVISGTEEARLIHAAAAYGAGGPGEIAVVIDVGGGSVEVTRGTGTAIELGRSFKLGVIRLTERFVRTDPLEPRDQRKLVRHIDGEIDLVRVWKRQAIHVFELIEGFKNLIPDQFGRIRDLADLSGRRFQFEHRTNKSAPSASTASSARPAPS